ncbi:MAG: response regulator [Sedimenticola sp.]
MNRISREHKTASDVTLHQGVGDVRVRLARRLSRGILLISVLLTLVATGFQVITQYNEEKALLELHFLEIEKLQLDSITRNVWLVDKGRLQLHVESIATIEYFKKVTVSDEKGDLLASAGQLEGETAIIRSYKLKYHFRGQEMDIGELSITASLAGVYQELLTQALVTFLIFSAVMAGVAVVVYLLIYRNIGSPLEKMADQVRGISAEHLPDPMVLERSVKGDEIDVLVNSFNEMRLRLANSLRALQDEIDERLQAEYEIRRLNASLEERVRQRTEELVEARDLAIASSRAKSAFLDNMSHELRTPLNAVLGFSQLLQRDPNLTEGMHESVGIIQKNGQHLLDLLNEILEMAGIESGRSKLDSIRFSPMEVAEETLDSVRERSLKSSLEFRLEMSDTVPEMVVSDGVKFQKILGHLLDNAEKFTDEGVITLNLDAHVQGENSVDLICTVTDTGIGIADDDLGRIFNFFTQAGREAENRGPGLGLAITRHYIDQLNGGISVDSRQGKGSMFRITIPVEMAIGGVEEPVQSQYSRVEGLAWDMAPPKLLIVEDQADNRRLLRRLLEPLAAEIREAVNGLEAVTMCTDSMPDLVWMDRRMPVMDGLEAARRIKELPGGDAVKIIALTASRFREQMIAAGHDDYVHKPFNVEEIFNCMAKHLGLQYVYQTPRGDAPPVSSLELDLAALKSLPMAKRDALREAVIALDVDQIKRLATEIEVLDMQLANRIRQEVDRLNMSALLKMLVEAG